jgi:hypothetical protein
VTCSECHRPVYRRTLCQAHYRRARGLAPGDPRGPVVTPIRRTGCVIDGCDGTHRAHGWCGKHYQRWLRYGDPLHIPTGGRGECATCADAEWLIDSGESGLRVCSRLGYAGDNSGRKALRQHLLRHGRGDLARRLEARREALV